MFDQTYNLMAGNDLYLPTQSSYGQNHGTETALLNVTDDILLLKYEKATRHSPCSSGLKCCLRHGGP